MYAITGITGQVGGAVARAARGEAAGRRRIPPERGGREASGPAERKQLALCK